MSAKQDGPLPDMNVVISIAYKTLASALETILWGAEIKLPQINMDVLTGWFQMQKRSIPRAKYGVLLAKQDVSTNIPRFYQALVDSNWRPLVARQVVSEHVDDAVNKLIEEQDLIIFDPSLVPSKKGNQSKRTLD